MHAFTNEGIRDVINRINPNLKLHDSTIAYIRIIFTPVYNSLSGNDNVEQIKDWGNNIFPPSGLDISSYIDDIIGQRPANILQSVKYGVIEWFINYLMNEVTNFITDSGYDEIGYDNIIFPWHVQYTISTNEYLPSILGIDVDDNTLPVNVIIQNTPTQYMFTDEFVYGLLLFSYAIGRDFHVSLFGFNIGPEYMSQHADQHFISNQQETYSVDVIGSKYYFHTSNFMQGFATGALWAGIDHHLYWSNLKNYFTDPQGINITF